MRIYITITEEPVYLNIFIKKIIQSIPSEIIGVGIVSGSLIKRKNIQSKVAYLITIALISNPIQLIKKMLIMMCFWILNINKYTKERNPFSIYKLAKEYNIPVIYVDNVNSPEFLAYLKKLKPTIIINQAQAILKEEFLSIPEIGCLNRHGALLPKYRGRLAPFWAYLNMEKETGISIHFIEKRIDTGPIIVQKKIRIERFDSLDSLLEKIFLIAPSALLEAIDMIRAGNYKERLIENKDELASYFSSPTIHDAIKYRQVMIKRWLNG